MRATCPSHLILLVLITLIICVEVYTYEAPHYAFFFSLLALPLRWSKYNILLSTLLSEALSLCYSCSKITHYF
jgi:hypothetical protein